MPTPETTTESAPEKTSLKLADVQALGFEFDTDPLAGANAALTQNFYFIRPAGDGMPAMRLNISRHLNTEVQLWNIVVYGGTAATTDLGTLIVSRASPRDILRSTTVKPEAVITTMQRFIAEVVEEARNPPEIESRCINCRRKINVLLKYCGLTDCEDVASRNSMRRTIH